MFGIETQKAANQAKREEQAMIRSKETTGFSLEQSIYVDKRTSSQIRNGIKGLPNPEDRIGDQTVTAAQSMIKSRSELRVAGRNDLVKAVNQTLLRMGEEVAQTLKALLEKGARTPAESVILAEKLAKGADVLAKLHTEAGL
jgi:hypothetical protein